MTPEKSNNFAALSELTKYLNRQPEKEKIKTNKFAGGSKYISIGDIEMMLDELFPGWSTSNQKIEILFGSIVCTISLRVYIKDVGYIQRDGSSAIPIQLNKGEKEISPMTIKSDALKKGVPAAKSQAIRNAAQSLGIQFGRNLNRYDVEESYRSGEDQMRDLSEKESRAIELLENCSLNDETKKNIYYKIESSTDRTLDDIINFLKKNQYG